MIKNEFDGLDIKPLESYCEGIPLSILIMGALAIVFRCIAFGIMKFYTARIDLFKKN